MQSKRIKRLALVVVFAGLVLGGWLATRDDAKVAAIGGTWRVESADWHVMDGNFRGAIVYEPVRVSLQPMEIIHILGSLCDATLENLGAAGQPDIAPEDIYRLEVNIRRDNGALGLDIAPPLPVVDGACKLDVFDGDLFFPTYPGVLEGWHVVNAGLLNSGAGTGEPMIMFAPLYAETRAPSTLDFLAACNAVIDDPIVWVNVGADAPTMGKVHIRAQSKLVNGTGLATYLQKSFSVLNGACLDAEAT